MSFEKVSDLFRWNREIFAVTTLKELEVVMESAKAFHVSVYWSVEICEVDLRDLIHPLDFKFILKFDEVVKKLGKFVASGLAQP